MRKQDGGASSARTFGGFFLVWARLQRWHVPALHWRIVHWLDHCAAETRVLLVFRGAAKSTLYAVYKAYRLWLDHQHRSLVWAADDKLATKLTRDTLAVLRRHPWCRGMILGKPGARSFWVDGATDARNPSMDAIGVNSNATGARSDAADFDDIEVPKNIKTVEGRENLRAKIEESTHILVPGGQKTYIGTPHTTESIYTEQIEAGAAMLKIPLFAHHARHEDTTGRVALEFDFAPEPDGLYVLAGIGRFARLLREGVDFKVRGRSIVLTKPEQTVVDIYSGCAWAERFTREEVARRRRETRTLNAWDSQYQLHAKPLAQIRLDPDKLIPYDCEPALRFANEAAEMRLGSTRIVSASCRIDPASNKPRSDVSSLSVVLQDEKGRYYWHRAIALTGEVAEFSRDGKTIVGGMVLQVADVVAELNLPRVDVETIGVGATWPAILRSVFRQRGLSCGVKAIDKGGAKNERILAAIEPPLRAGHLWAHVSVIEAVEQQMRDWNPAVREQSDDHLDSCAGAIEAEPVRIGSAVPNSKKAHSDSLHSWQPDAGTFEVTLDLS